MQRTPHVRAATLEAHLPAQPQYRLGIDGTTGGGSAAAPAGKGATLLVQLKTP